MTPTPSFGHRQVSDNSEISSSSFLYDENLAPERQVFISPIGLLFLGLGLLGLGLGVTPLNRALDDHRYGQWTAPAYSDLQQTSGTLLPAKLFLYGGSHGRSWYIGRLLRDDGNLLEFSCYPHEDDQGCLYTRPEPYNETPLLGKRVTMRYFYPPNSVEPAYPSDLTSSWSGGRNTIPPMSGAVVMEAAVDDGASQRTVLTYDQSQRRLNAIFLWGNSVALMLAASGLLSILLAITLLVVLMQRAKTRPG